ncbi:uncharacterized protein LOC142976539 [Anticarsia gemmatalis]|uniref:uncharacterized protein LOC142976539 n=1 Tax=Anticarsia gemmatalis TaxID=129554 RepID=UPI003F77662A
MELMLFLLVSILVTTHVKSQQKTSSEDINNILDKLIRQVNDTSSEVNGPERRGFFDSDEQQQSRSASTYVKEKESIQKQFKTDETDKNYSVLENLFQKDIKKLKPATEPSPYGRIPSKPLSLLHDYPEVVIDHINFDNDEKTDLSRKNIIGQAASGNFGDAFGPVSQRDDFSYPVIKGLVESIIQNKVIQDSIMSKLTENESKKQSDLLEQILQKLPDRKPQSGNMESIEARDADPYPLTLDSLPQNEMGGITSLQSYLQDSQSNAMNRLSTTYLQGPVISQKWPALPNAPMLMGPYMPHSRRGMSRPDVLKWPRLVTSLVHRIRPSPIYRASYYG